MPKKKKPVEEEEDDDEEEEEEIEEEEELQDHHYKPDLEKEPVEWHIWANLVISEPDSEKRNAWLGMIHEDDEMLMIVNRKNHPMPYPILTSWSDWCRKQGKGVRPPHEFLKLRVPNTPEDWSIPMWIPAVLFLLFSIGIMFTGVSIFWWFIFDFMAYILFMIVLAAWTHHKYDKPGYCHNCGIKIPVRTGLKGKSNNPFKRGKIVVLTKAGLCQPDDPNTNNCEWNIKRFTKVNKQRNLVWDSIKLNHVRGLFFRIYKDTRNNKEYTNKDYKMPIELADDTMEEDGLQEIESGTGKLRTVQKSKKGRLRLQGG